MLSTILVVTAFTVALLKWISYRRSRYYQLLSKLPGPPSRPILTHAWDILGGTDHFHNLLQVEWTKIYGEIFLTKIGMHDIVFISAPELLEPVLRSSTLIDKGGTYDTIVPWLGDGLLLSTGLKWKSRRKLLTPAFHFNILDHFVDVFNAQARILCDILNKRTSGKKVELDVLPLVARCSLDIICEAAMGTQIKAQTEETDYVKAVDGITNLVMERFRSPWLANDTIFSLTPLGMEQQKLLKTLHGFTNEVIEKKQKNFAQKTNDPKEGDDNPIRKKRRPFLDLLLEASAKNSDQLTQQDIREEVDTFMFEGHDTVSAAMSWFLYCMASNQVHQTKVWEELNAVFEGSDRDCTQEDMAELKYLESCMKESLRLYPSVPIIARRLTEDVKLGDYLIPAGCNVTMLIFASHRNPRIYPDPLTFNPDRWQSEQSAGRHAYAYVPFSAGPRNCIGQRFALMEEKAVISHLLRRFRFELSPNLEKPIPSQQTILKPIRGVKLMVSSRS